MSRFSEFLRDLGYPYVEETQNVIYKRYLRKQRESLFTPSFCLGGVLFVI